MGGAVQNDAEVADMNNEGNDFWNQDFAGGNSNIEQPGAEDPNDNAFPAEAVEEPIEFGEPQEQEIFNKPKVGHAFEAPLSPEEEIRVQQIEQEQAERLRSLQMKEEEEYKEKKNKQMEARTELDNWYSQKNTEREAKSRQNKEEEWAYLQTRDEHKKSKNPWEKIVDNVEINPNKYLGNKDVSRMRQAMLARKGDLKDGRI